MTASVHDKRRSGESGSEDDEISRLVREGIRPEGMKDRLNLAADKLVGKVPLGIDAPNKTARKLIGGSAELLHVLKYGFPGLFLFLAGIIFLYVGLAGGPSLETVAIGAALVTLGAWGLRSAYQAARNLRYICKA